MRRRTTLGDRNLVGENIIRIRAEKKMSQGELLSNSADGYRYEPSKAIEDRRKTHCHNRSRLDCNRQVFRRYAG